MVKSTVGLDLTQFAAEQQRRFDLGTSPSDRKERGHFGTPVAIAEFMAGMFSEAPEGKIRILDPGAGVGMLSAAVCQQLLSLETPRHVDFELWEQDARLILPLRNTLDHCRKSLMEVGHRLDFSICVDDFILANTSNSLYEDGKTGSFHFAILNPPYYKVRKESPQARAMDHVVHGQPNVYAFFMAVAADLLLPGGQLVAITPRSYFNGAYFKKFRRWFFDRMTARQIHVFESRSEAFQNDDVLQENVILLAEKGGSPTEIAFSSSVGGELCSVERSAATYDKIIDNSNGERIIRIATNHLDHEIVSALDALPERFRSLGFEISTGPVVTFRSTEYLRGERSKATAPLLWMHNVRPFVTRFPPTSRKPGHIEVAEGSMRLLLPAKRYVLLKRFTAKEEKRRLVAGVMESTDSYSEWVGLENHLNYVYRTAAELTKTEAFGLAAYFNSALVDRYFRAISGNTQVNATEIRQMPMPDEQTLSRIGEGVESADDHSCRTVERIVGQALGLSESLLEILCEVA